MAQYLSAAERLLDDPQALANLTYMIDFRRGPIADGFAAFVTEVDGHLLCALVIGEVTSIQSDDTNHVWIIV